LPLPFLSLCDTKKSRKLASPQRALRCHTGSWFCARAAPGVGGPTPSGHSDDEEKQWKNSGKTVKNSDALREKQ
jgi:hypothetical protein